MTEHEIEKLKKEVEDKERAYNDEFCLRKEWQTKYKELLKELKESRNTINRQKAEIEKLNKDCEDIIYKLEYLLSNATGNKFSKHTYPISDMVSYVNDYIQDCCNEAVEEAKEAIKSKAIKEFSEKIKRKATIVHTTRSGIHYYEIDDNEIDSIVKEME